MKKVIAWILLIALTATATVSGTLAYLTDRESEANVFTSGKVDIALDEEFESRSELIPGKEINKDVAIKNIGDNVAWVWYTYAVPKGLEDGLELTFEGDWINSGYVGDYTDENGIAYSVYARLYREKLAVGDTTTTDFTSVKLSSSVDIDPAGDWYTVVQGETTELNWKNSNGTPYIFINAFAIQATDDLTNVVDGYTAFVGQWGDIVSAGTYELFDAWNGTVDTSWYNDTDTEFVITTAEQLAGLAELVDGGNSFEGKTIKLGMGIDLYCDGENGEPVSFDPIGDKSAFAGTFDGQGHTISNLYQSGWAFGYEWGSYGSIGLFGELESATVKNVTISGAETFVEGGDVGGITGSATGNCVFENITIEDSDIATYNNGLGGIIGWSGAGNYTFKNITIAADTVLAGLWGSFDSSIGGVVGQGEPGATYNFENVNIACRIDAYNDCTASYDYYNYRMCGMIIGRLAETTTIDGVNYPDTSKYNITCNDVTVTYGEWADYHYCEPTPGLNGGRGMRVEPGYSYDGLPADFDHTQCTTNHMTLIPFDQIFGGDQLGVKGLKTYDGVTVIYNNQ